MISTIQFQYSQPFRETISLIESIMADWFAGPRDHDPDLDSIQEAVHLKNSSRMLTHTNTAYREFFTSGILPTGKSGETFLGEPLILVSQHSDTMLLNGSDTTRIEFDHACLGPDNRKYMLVTHKRLLTDFQFEPYTILGISRKVSMCGEPHESNRDIASIFKVFEQLSATDKRFCDLYSEGYSMREIAAKLELSTKAIDNHRKKILQVLGLEKPVELIKLMVRFDERGLG